MKNQTLKSKLYKLVSNGKIIAEGNRKSMHKMCKQTPSSFVGLGSPASSIGKLWGAK